MNMNRFSWTATESPQVLARAKSNAEMDVSFEGNSSPTQTGASTPVPTTPTRRLQGLQKKLDFGRSNPKALKEIQSSIKAFEKKESNDQPCTSHDNGICENMSPDGGYKSFMSCLDESPAPFSLKKRKTDLSNTNPYTPEYRKKTGSRLRRSELIIISSKKRFETDFEILKQVGRGHFGRVYQVKHRLDGAIYAVKECKLSGKKLSQKHLNELMACAALASHENIVRYYSSWYEGDFNGHGSYVNPPHYVYIQSEFCTGGSLQARLQVLRLEKRKMKLPHVKHLGVQVLKGLSFIHSTCICAHLDIKPANILRTTHPENPVFSEDYPLYKLGDLGHVSLAYVGDDNKEEGDRGYLAHELLDHSSLSKHDLTKADIFSTALTLYECATNVEIPQQGDEYKRLRFESLPEDEGLDSDFRNVLNEMKQLEYLKRPTASQLLNHKVFAVKTEAAPDQNEEKMQGMVDDQTLSLLAQLNQLKLENQEKDKTIAELKATQGCNSGC